MPTYDSNGNPVYTSPKVSGASYNYGSLTPNQNQSLTGNSAGGNSDAFLESIIPGLGGQKNQVGGIITNLLNGDASPSVARNAAATFGANSGLGTGSGVTNRFGYDLYNQMGANRQQQGIGNLLSVISGYSQPALQYQGQQQQNNQFNQAQGQQNTQFNQSLQQNQNQFDTTNQLNQFLAQLQALGLGNSITSNSYQLPTINF